MSDLYYTQEEIDKLQKDIIEEYYKYDTETIEKIKKYKIIGYENGNIQKGFTPRTSDWPILRSYKYVSFINIYGFIFNGIEEEKDDTNPENHKFLLKAFSNEIYDYNTYSQYKRYIPFEIDLDKEILIPKIILKNIIDNKLIYQLGLKNYRQIKNCIIQKKAESSIISNCSEKYKDFIDIIMKERDQEKEIEELKSKLAEQTKLNDEICERMFELKEQLLQ
jgi:hypothetical protein